jgi:hypothetical protein
MSLIGFRVKTIYMQFDSVVFTLTLFVTFFVKGDGENYNAQ